MKRLPGEPGDTMPFLYNLPWLPCAVQGVPAPSYPRSSLSAPTSLHPRCEAKSLPRAGAGHRALKLGSDNNSVESTPHRQARGCTG